MRAGTRRLTGLAIVLVAVGLLWGRAPYLKAQLAQKPWDGLVDWTAARAFWEHKDPYSPEELKRAKLDGLGHPPTTSFWFLGLARFPLEDLSRSLAIVTVALLWSELALILRVAGLALWGPWALLIATLVLKTEWMSWHLYLAQVSQLIAFLLVLCWFFARQRRDGWAGVCFGLACTLKLYPGLLGIFFLLQRRWRLVTVGAIVYLAIAALMTSRFGWQSWREFADTEKIIVDFWIGDMRNASLPGIVTRIFTPVCVKQGGYRPIVSAISSTVTIVIAVLFYWTWRRLPSQARRTPLFAHDLPYALFATLGVFANPFAYEHYYVLLLPPMIAVIAGLVQWRPRGVREQVGWSAVAALQASALFPLVDEPWRRLNYLSLRTPAGHVRQHLLEIENWWPYVAVLLALYALLRRSYRVTSSDASASESLPRKTAMETTPEAGGPDSATSSV